MGQGKTASQRFTVLRQARYVKSPPDLTASSATWRARTGSGRTGVDDNSIAPRRNTRLPRTFPPSQVTVVSLVSIASPDSKAADSESGTAARMRAPLVMREVRATASHGCPSSPGAVSYTHLTLPTTPYV